MRRPDPFFTLPVWVLVMAAVLGFGAAIFVAWATKDIPPCWPDCQQVPR